MQTEKLNEENRTFDQAHNPCCQCRIAKHKVTGALRQMGNWFSRHEPLPKEFQHLTPTESNDQERLKGLWNRFL